MLIKFKITYKNNLLNLNLFIFFIFIFIFITFFLTYSPKFSESQRLPSLFLGHATYQSQFQLFQSDILSL